ncbi:putative Fungal-specific transcription factor domain-containing protein [Seiridium cardinale]
MCNTGNFSALKVVLILRTFRFKEKKKKCDERRPQCARCAERSLPCNYEAVKPRQRRKRDSDAGSMFENQLENNDTQDEPWHYSEDVEEINRDDCISLGDSMPDNSSMGTTDMLLSPTTTNTFNFTDDDHDRSRHGSLVRRSSEFSVASNPICLPPDLALIAPVPLASPTLDFCIPAFNEFSDRPNRRALVDHFCNVLSHLIVFREESGNPFQQLVLPLSHESSPVMNAIYALASAHLEYRGVPTGEKSLYFHNEAIQGLAHLIESGDKANHKNELLAAIMLLVYYEVLVQRGRSNIVDGHLRGALTIMESSSGDSSPTGIFLERAFRFYDVITALSLGTAPIATAPAAGCLIPLPPPDAPIASPLSNVDTLLGMATTLWPIMHRLSNLFSLKNELDNAFKASQSSKVAVLRSEFETTSRAIEVALERWQPSLPPNIRLRNDRLETVGGQDMPERNLLHSILHNALAYRHSAFVYLYRTIYGYSPNHPLVQRHVHNSLVYCSQCVDFKGPMGALLWPLFVAACEAITDEDRVLAERTFREFDTHQGMTNIDNAWGVVREVWKQHDLLSVTPYGAKDADLWRRVSKEMGVCIVLG